MIKLLVLIPFMMILQNLTFAGTGVVLVLQAPLLSQDLFDSHSVAHVRRGQEIFIHDKHFGLSSVNITFPGMADDEDIDRVEDGYSKEGFFQTLDASGNVAYIERKYVKLIYNDERELQSSVKPFKYDPTDYRLEEPLPQAYPLFAEKTYRAGAYMAFGPARKLNYNYTKPITRQSFTGRMGAELFYSKKVEFDIYDRFYFGGMGHVYSFNSEATLTDLTVVEEKGGEFGAGPFLSYIYFRNKNWRLALTGGLTLNYFRQLVTQRAVSGDQEQRFFEGFYFTPKIKTYLVNKNFLPTVDFMAGFDVTINLPTNFTSNTPIANSSQWQDDVSSDNIHLPFGAVWSFIIGINATY